MDWIFYFSLTLPNALNRNDLMIISCDWSVKDNDNESNSQPPLLFHYLLSCCDWSVKDNDNESNSQQVKCLTLLQMCCDWSVKDNDNESNSQRSTFSILT